jgi:hypothetical protein
LLFPDKGMQGRVGQTQPGAGCYTADPRKEQKSVRPIFSFGQGQRSKDFFHLLIRQWRAGTPGALPQRRPQQSQLADEAAASPAHGQVDPYLESFRPRQFMIYQSACARCDFPAAQHSPVSWK